MQRLNVNAEVDRYIQSHPSIKDCLKKGIINYSKLSRLISNEIGMKKTASFDAILISCRRHQQRLKTERGYEKKIMSVMQETTIETMSHVLVATIEKDVFFDHLVLLQKRIRDRKEMFQFIEGVKAITVITRMEFSKDIEKIFRTKVLSLKTGLALITLRSPLNVEETPGFVGYIYSLLGENGINILETMSCWTDTLFVVNDSDMEKAIRLMK